MQPLTIVPPADKSFGIKPQAHSANFTENNDNAWLLENGASHHVTNDLGQFSLHNPYDGTEELLIGDGKGIALENIGSTNLNISSQSLVLNNVLHAPSISRNIISISEFCNDNNASVEFLSSCFSVKDISTGRVLV